AELSGRDHINLYSALWEEDKSHGQAVIERLNMESYVNRPVDTYSLGMKQRLCFAMLLSANSPVMLMDEVMNGLDPDNVDLITNILMDFRLSN
ncbi:MAG: ATP-binding cassette domain-containing protein, partial [Tetragenococcus koreensis]|nr:ATP-binding cassette domain-containing protein [Tetragenococcus koreensis]